MCVSCFAKINLMDIFIQNYDNKLVTASCKEDSCDNKNAPTMACNGGFLRKVRQKNVVCTQ